MDTRHKILTRDAALALTPGELTLVTGYFDALRAAHLRDLEALPRPILAVVLPCDDELVPQPARAEMLAGLRRIDYVLMADASDIPALIERLKPRAVARFEAADRARVQELIEHVHRRHTT
jgi:hypothetical protein